MEIIVNKSDYTDWAYSRLNEEGYEYAYPDYNNVTKCRLTSLEFHHLFNNRSSELNWGRQYLICCILPRQVLRVLHHNNGAVVLKGEEVSQWIDFVAKTERVYTETLKV
jgi:hypothetical protein